MVSELIRMYSLVNDDKIRKLMIQPCPIHVIIIREKSETKSRFTEYDEILNILCMKHVSDITKYVREELKTITIYYVFFCFVFYSFLIKTHYKIWTYDCFFTPFGKKESISTIKIITEPGIITWQALQRHALNREFNLIFITVTRNK